MAESERSIEPPYSSTQVGSSSQLGDGDRQHSNKVRHTQGISKSRLIRKKSNSVAEHYDNVKMLGKGAQGTVFLVREKKTEQMAVSKTINTEKMEEKDLDMIRKEISILRTMDHPYIVKIYEFAEEEKVHTMTLILEYASGGDCRQLLDNKPGNRINEILAGRLIHQLLVALAYCHTRDVMHCDIKPDNMMLSYFSGQDEPDIKVIDFGVAEMNRLRKSEYRGIVGTPAYIAPEVITPNADSSPPGDVWATACVAIEMLTGVTPFGTTQDHGGKLMKLLQHIRAFKDFEEVAKRLKSKGATSKAWSECSPAACKLLKTMLDPDPVTRPKALAAVKDPWVQKYKAHYPEISREVSDGFARFATDASPILRCCLLTLALRDSDDDHVKNGYAFVGANKSGSGTLSKKELTDALNVSPGWKERNIDVGDLFRSMDFSHSNSIGFTEFTAACLFGKYNSSDQIFEDTFEALDTDNDGFISMADILDSLNERAAKLLPVLPRDWQFDIEEWCICIEDASRKDRVKFAGTEVPQVIASGAATASNGLFACCWGASSHTEQAIHEVPAEPR